MEIEIKVIKERIVEVEPPVPAKDPLAFTPRNYAAIQHRINVQRREAKRREEEYRAKRGW